MAFQETYMVLSTNGVGRGRRAASIFILAATMVALTADSSRPNCEAMSAGSRAIHKTFFAGL
jgi:hypothetical protein